MCSAAKVDAVLALGADRVLDHARGDVFTEPGRYDVIVDIAGRSPVPRLRRALVPDGTLVMVGGESGGRWTAGYGRPIRASMRSPFVRQRLVMLASRERSDDLVRLTAMIESGSISPLVDGVVRVVALDGAAGAMHRLVAGQVTGKLAIQVA